MNNFLTKIKSLFGTKIENKLILLFIILSLTPTIFVGAFSYYKSSSSLKNGIKKYSKQIMMETAINIQTNMDAFNLICDEILLLDDIQNGLENYHTIDIMEKREIKKNINQYLYERFQLQKYLTDIQIVTNSFDFLFSYGYCYFDMEDIKSISKMADEKDGLVGWSQMYLKNRDNVLVFRKIKSKKSKQGIGYVIMSINEGLLSNVYKNIDLGDNADIFIMDKTGMVMSSVNADIPIGSKYKEISVIETLRTWEENKESVFSTVINKEKYLIPHASLNDGQWFLVSTIPYSYFNKQSNEIKLSILVVCIVCFIGIVFLALLLAKIIWKPLNNLVGHMKDVKEGNFDIIIHSEGNDEISYLTSTFKSMINQIKQLIEKVKNEQKEKRETEIQMLQAQINPHFLFNTLNSLKWTAKMSQAHSVSKGLGALSEILRNTIVEKNELITIEEELKNIRNYIVIQKIRYGNTLEINYDIDKDLMDYKILKFLLQPIIENSIIHGLGDIDYQGRIMLAFYPRDQYIKIIIRDNGKGMDEEKIKKYMVSHTEHKERFSSIGIHNVQERIQLNFRLEYGLHIESERGGGTTVTMTIPIIHD